MKCVDVRSNLSAYIDGETEEQLHSAIEAHLASCHDCTEEAEVLRGISHQVKTLSPVVAPESVDAAVFAAFRSVHPKHHLALSASGWKTIPRIAWAAFAFSIAIASTAAFLVGAEFGTDAGSAQIAITSDAPVKRPPQTEPEIRTVTVTEYVKEPCAQSVKKLGGFTAANQKKRTRNPGILVTDADLSGMKPLAKLEIAVIKE